MQIILANFEIAEDETIYPRLTFERHMQIVRAMWEFQTYARFSQVRCPVLALPAQPPPPVSSMEQEYLERKRGGAEKVLAANPAVRIHWMEDAIHDSPAAKAAGAGGAYPGLRALSSGLKSVLGQLCNSCEGNIYHRDSETTEKNLNFKISVHSVSLW